MNTILILSMLAVSITSSIVTRVYLSRKAAYESYLKRKRNENYGEPLGYKFLKKLSWSDLTLDIESQFFIDMDKYHIQFYSESMNEWCDSEIDNPFLLMNKLSNGYLKYRYRLKEVNNAF